MKTMIDVRYWIHEGPAIDNQVWHQVGDQVRSRLCNQLWHRVEDRVWGEVGRLVWDEIEDRMGDRR